MGIEKTIAKFCVQTAVYWKKTGLNGFGGIVFNKGVEIKVRWDDKSRSSRDKGTTDTGQEIISKTEILSNYEMEIGDFVYLGTLAELSVLGYSHIISNFNPHDLEKAFEIKDKDKIPMVKKTNDFVRKYYL